jgi:hypothetical protein
MDIQSWERVSTLMKEIMKSTPQSACTSPSSNYEHFYLCGIAQGGQGKYNTHLVLLLALVFFPLRLCQLK